MKAPVGLLSGRAVCVSRWRGFAPTSSAERSKRIFTGGVMEGNGICSAAFCGSAALRGRTRILAWSTPSVSLRSPAPPGGAPFGVAAKFATTAKAVPLGKVAKPQALTEGVTSGQANFALEPETLPPCQRLPPRGSCQNRQVLTEGVKLSPWESWRGSA